jgi:hypothetical protein
MANKVVPGVILAACVIIALTVSARMLEQTKPASDPANAHYGPGLEGNQDAFHEAAGDATASFMLALRTADYKRALQLMHVSHRTAADRAYDLRWIRTQSTPLIGWMSFAMDQNAPIRRVGAEVQVTGLVVNAHGKPVHVLYFLLMLPKRAYVDGFGVMPGSMYNSGGK